MCPTYTRNGVSLHLMTKKSYCFKLPPGWSCSLEGAHEGACHATQVVQTKPVHVPCETYTEYKPGFGLCKEQREAIRTWMDEHDRTKHAKAFRHGVRYTGAIGGAYTYRFTDTSLGTVVTVHCGCGEAIDVSDYDQW